MGEAFSHNLLEVDRTHQPVRSWETDVSLPLPDPILNGIRITHEELRAIHKERNLTRRDATAMESLFGPRLLFPDKGERVTHEVLQRDTDGSLKVLITVRLVGLQRPYTRRIRLVKQRKTLPWSVRQRLRES
jgi:hypothetical protein